MTTKAYAYMRTSSATNVQKKDARPEDYKDSAERQLAAIQQFCASHDHEIVGEPFYDEDVKGADPIISRPAFADMLERILANGVKTIIVETANRFSRDLITQEIGYKMLKDKGITLISADRPDMFLDDSPTAVLIRQILGAVSQFEKDMLVLKLRGARQRKKKATGMKVEGAPSHAQLIPGVVAAARQLRAEGKTLREVSTHLMNMGYGNEAGNFYSASAVSRMLKGA